MEWNDAIRVRVVMERRRKVISGEGEGGVCPCPSGWSKLLSQRKVCSRLGTWNWDKKKIMGAKWERNKEQEPEQFKPFTFTIIITAGWG